MSARGVLEGTTVHVPDTAEANRLHNKGHVGTPTKDNTLRLTIVEAIHCIHAGRLTVDSYDAVALLRLAAVDGEQTEIDHLAYHDLRERGLVVRPAGPATYTVWKRGDGPKQEPWFTTRVVAERSPVQPDDLRGTDMVSVVDENGGVIHYEVTAVAPQGDIPMPTVPACDGTLLDDRVLVTDPDACVALASGFVGTSHPDGRILSLTEADALRREGTLRLPDELPAHAAARQPRFHVSLRAYDALRSAGVVARSGFRFGTHLRGYRTDPDNVHAEWLIHCADGPLAWSEISRGVRLAHGVRKSFLVAHGDPIQFTGIAWFRP